ncbi:MAG: DNA polymerase IV [Candidatus Methanomethylophilaceae archaeon]|nr:DNA polymerase IV [Candidatus Methanomethylophilaceae archaeon]
MQQIIIHVDMDAFYASVEVRDDPSLRGKPVIIGALPHERGVVSTCSYEAREYGVHSAMNVKEAYSLCPDGIFLHPNFDKYKAVSQELHRIWEENSLATEPIALDEAYLDVTGMAADFEEARTIAVNIKNRIAEELRLSCSVGVAYCKMAAKTASEEMKPGGYFEIRTPQDFINLVIDRDVSVLHSVGKRTADKLREIGITTVRDLIDRKYEVMRLLGSQGEYLAQVAIGIDDSKVVAYRPEDAKSISRELTFQEDVYDYGFLEDVLLLLSLSVEDRQRRYGLHGTGIALKVTYSDMRSITRSKTVRTQADAAAVYQGSVEMLRTVRKRPVRLIGAGVFNLSHGNYRQTTLDEDFDVGPVSVKSTGLDDAIGRLRERYGDILPDDLVHLNEYGSMHRLVENMRIHRMYR